MFLGGFPPRKRWFLPCIDLVVFPGKRLSCYLISVHKTKHFEPAIDRGNAVHKSNPVMRMNPSIERFESATSHTIRPAKATKVSLTHSKPPRSPFPTPQGKVLLASNQNPNSKHRPLCDVSAYDDARTDAPPLLRKKMRKGPKTALPKLCVGLGPHHFACSLFFPSSFGTRIAEARRRKMREGTYPYY
jgi:hypothetical protein